MKTIKNIKKSNLRKKINSKPAREKEFIFFLIAFPSLFVIVSLSRREKDGHALFKEYFVDFKKQFANSKFWHGR